MAKKKASTFVTSTQAGTTGSTSSTGSVDPVGEVVAETKTEKVVATPTAATPGDRITITIMSLKGSPWPGDFRLRIGGNTAIFCQTKKELLGVLDNALPD
jgi:hypothetical protein